jgi:uncharacterized membrane protein
MLGIIGLLVAAVGGIWLAVVAFQESILWGLGCLLVPIVGLVFVLTHWDTAKIPFLVQVAGIILYVVGGGA